MLRSPRARVLQARAALPCASPSASATPSAFASPFAAVSPNNLLLHCAQFCPSASAAPFANFLSIVAAARAPARHRNRGRGHSPLHPLG